ncbi:SDR family oxidoreductase [Lacihabitans sp. LS3-19]|uniref:SDR family oxidoreductase n=1 Tax=Lacihabitans sp. LS3-19 TaxID=2487335 RepID=UPI0020CBEF3A|nr:SDR family oxidoreductase [Lacihabitans sp. LS3-19]MCP9767481.1 SDR family oxidoreductase [Lacihabitans sp. LS3-19]
MNLNLENKTALVCGSTQGIGWATAIELAELGANIVLMARNEESLKNRTEELPKAKNQSHQYLVADFTSNDNVKTVISSFIASGNKIDILINNTGGPAGGAIIDESPEKFQEVFNQHLINNQILTQAVVPGMKQAGFGRIVNIISVSVKQPIVGLGVSNTIRWAVASWAKTLSKEIAGSGITVNNVLPGYTQTQRLENVNQMRADSLGIEKSEVEKQIIANVPVGKFASAEEVAAAVAFLCSPAASSINGINLPVDGGLSMSL